jgi:2-oxoglutarate dehydrogenase E2 component (dihydrolipoamide succinyltransferase)
MKGARANDSLFVCASMTGIAMGRRYELTLPELGLQEGPITVSLWLVEPGSMVAEGDPVVEVLAGAAVVDLPSPTDGVLVECLVAEDDPVEVGQVLAVVESEDDP